MAHILDGIDIIYWINLDRAKDRRKHMEKNVLNDDIFKNKKVVRIKAVDYKDNNLDKYFKIDFNYKTSNKEYACLASHLETIRTFSKTDYNTALIFEDDVSIDYKKYWTKSIQEVIQNAPKDWEIVKLCIWPYMEFKSEYTLWKPTCEYKNGEFKNKADWGCIAYIINMKGAKNLMDKLYIDNKYDLSNSICNVADYLLYTFLRTYTYKYEFFPSRKNNDTYIQLDNCKEKNRRYLNDVKTRNRIIKKREAILRTRKNKTRKNKNP
uniref:Glycosyl transferase family 25 domain-containing protein n=1 Tax=viral metagenome TaxID=1070528 RepID=A0A6C0D3V1_9ZZZZ